MMDQPGKMLIGDEEHAKASYEKMNNQPVDWDLSDTPVAPLRQSQTTIESTETISGPGTFMGRALRTITFEPTARKGWWLDRTDRPDSLPIKVGINNVWTTGQIVSNIVLRSGNPHNYVRMVEHLISLRMGLGIDNLMIKIDSGDPPLFEQGSFDVVEALQKCGRVDIGKPVEYCTVKEPVTVVGNYGDFVTLEPPDDMDNPGLLVDCAVDFPTAIGQQRIIFPVTEELTRTASYARTNTSLGKVIYCATIGRLFADVRNLGYSKKNVLIAGKKKYVNEPRLPHEGKPLEAVWHRAVLDLLAAVALINNGLFVGKVKSYKAGHRLDCDLVKQLYLNEMLVPWEDYKDSK